MFLSEDMPNEQFAICRRIHQELQRNGLNIGESVGNLGTYVGITISRTKIPYVLFFLNSNTLATYRPEFIMSLLEGNSPKKTVRVIKLLASGILDHWYDTDTGRCSYCGVHAHCSGATEIGRIDVLSVQHDKDCPVLYAYAERLAGNA